MNWLRVHIDLQHIDPAPIEQALVALGALSIDFRDAADHPILEPAPGATPLWPTLRATALFADTIDNTTIRLAIAGAIEGDCMPPLSFEPMTDQDWIENWQQTLEPMQFGNRLWIYPTGSTHPEPDTTVITLDPGLAFGTGSHPTTAMCLDWLTNFDNDQGTLLDYGCGSGILSIAALALGATRVLGVDLDDQALRATQENAERNQVAERLTIARPETAHQYQEFDRLVANILSGTLIELATDLKAFCRTGTRIALSGILTDQTESVMAAYEPWVAFEPVIERDDWALLSGTVVVT